MVTRIAAMFMMLIGVANAGEWSVSSREIRPFEGVIIKGVLKTGEKNPKIEVFVNGKMIIDRKIKQVIVIEDGDILGVVIPVIVDLGESAFVFQKPGKYKIEVKSGNDKMISTDINVRGDHEAAMDVRPLAIITSSIIYAPHEYMDVNFPEPAIRSVENIAKNEQGVLSIYAELCRLIIEFEKTKRSAIGSKGDVDARDEKLASFATRFHGISKESIFPPLVETARYYEALAFGFGKNYEKTIKILEEIVKNRGKYTPLGVQRIYKELMNARKIGKF